MNRNAKCLWNEKIEKFFGAISFCPKPFVLNGANGILSTSRANAKWIYCVVGGCNAGGELIECPIRSNCINGLIESQNETFGAQCAALNANAIEKFWNSFSGVCGFFSLATWTTESTKSRKLINKCHAMCNYWIVRFSRASLAVTCVRKAEDAATVTQVTWQ